MVSAHCDAGLCAQYPHEATVTWSPENDGPLFPPAQATTHALAPAVCACHCRACAAIRDGHRAAGRWP